VRSTRPGFIPAHDGKPPCRKWNSTILSSHDLNRPEAERFRVKLANLKIPKIDLVKVFIGLEQMDEDVHRVFFCSTELGEFNSAEMRFRPAIRP
jgi:hypothetical protein